MSSVLSMLSPEAGSVEEATIDDKNGSYANADKNH